MKLKQILNSKFKLLDAKSSRLFLVVFTFVYSVLFLYIFMPFNMKDWDPLSRGSQFLVILEFAMVGAIVLSFSQFLLRKWMRMEKFRIKQFLIWLLFELILLTLLLTIIFVQLVDGSDFLYEFSITFKHTFFIIIIPYSIVLLILSLFHSKSELIKMKKESKELQVKTELIKFPDENGNIKFTLPLKDFLYLESTDNYVFVHYQDQKETRKELLRNSLKNLESIFDSLPVKRCHRSFMVNLMNLSLAKKSGQKTILKLNSVSEQIPVSKSYQKAFMAYFETNLN